MDHVRTSCRVTRLTYDPAAAAGRGRWRATYMDASRGKRYTAAADCVVLATGHPCPTAAELGLGQGCRVLHAASTTAAAVASSPAVAVLGSGVTAEDCAAAVSLLRKGRGVRLVRADPPAAVTSPLAPSPAPGPFEGFSEAFATGVTSPHDSSSVLATAATPTFAGGSTPATTQNAPSTQRPPTTSATGYLNPFLASTTTTTALAPARIVHGANLLEAARRRALAASLQPHYALPPPSGLTRALRAPGKRRFWSAAKARAAAVLGGGACGQARDTSEAPGSVAEALTSARNGQEQLVLWAPSFADPRVMPFLDPVVRAALLRPPQGGSAAGAGPGGAAAAAGADGELCLYRGILRPDVRGLAFVGYEAHASSSLLLLQLQAQWLVYHLAKALPQPSPAEIAADIARQRSWRSAALAAPLMSCSDALARTAEQHAIQQLLDDMQGLASLQRGTDDGGDGGAAAAAAAPAADPAVLTVLPMISPPAVLPPPSPRLASSAAVPAARPAPLSADCLVAAEVVSVTALPQSTQPASPQPRPARSAAITGTGSFHSGGNSGTGLFQRISSRLFGGPRAASSSGFTKPSAASATLGPATPATLAPAPPQPSPANSAPGLAGLASSQAETLETHEAAVAAGAASVRRPPGRHASMPLVTAPERSQRRASMTRLGREGGGGERMVLAVQPVVAPYLQDKLRRATTSHLSDDDGPRSHTSHASASNAQGPASPPVAAASALEPHHSGSLLRAATPLVPFLPSPKNPRKSALGIASPAVASPADSRANALSEQLRHMSSRTGVDLSALCDLVSDDGLAQTPPLLASPLGGRPPALGSALRSATGAPLPHRRLVHQNSSSSTGMAVGSPPGPSAPLFVMGRMTSGRGSIDSGLGSAPRRSSSLLIAAVNSDGLAMGSPRRAPPPGLIAVGSPAGGEGLRGTGATGGKPHASPRALALGVPVPVPGPGVVPLTVPDGEPLDPTADDPDDPAAAPGFLEGETLLTDPNADLTFAAAAAALASCAAFTAAALVETHDSERRSAGQGSLSMNVRARLAAALAAEGDGEEVVGSFHNPLPSKGSTAEAHRFTTNPDVAASAPPLPAVTVPAAGREDAPSSDFSLATPAGARVAEGGVGSSGKSTTRALHRFFRPVDQEQISFPTVGGMHPGSAVDGPSPSAATAHAAAARTPSFYRAYARTEPPAAPHNNDEDVTARDLGVVMSSSQYGSKGSTIAAMFAQQRSWLDGHGPAPGSVGGSDSGAPRSAPLMTLRQVLAAQAQAQGQAGPSRSPQPPLSGTQRMVSAGPLPSQGSTGGYPVSGGGADAAGPSSRGESSAAVAGQQLRSAFAGGNTSARTSYSGVAPGLPGGGSPAGTMTGEDAGGGGAGGAVATLSSQLSALRIHLADPARFPFPSVADAAPMPPPSPPHAAAQQAPSPVLRAHSGLPVAPAPMVPAGASMLRRRPSSPTLNLCTIAERPPSQPSPGSVPLEGGAGNPAEPEPAPAPAPVSRKPPVFSKLSSGALSALLQRGPGSSETLPQGPKPFSQRHSMDVRGGAAAATAPKRTAPRRSYTQQSLSSNGAMAAADGGPGSAVPPSPGSRPTMLPLFGGLRSRPGSSSGGVMSPGGPGSGGLAAAALIPQHSSGGRTSGSKKKGVVRGASLRAVFAGLVGSGNSEANSSGGGGGILADAAAAAALPYRQRVGDGSMGAVGAAAVAAAARLGGPDSGGLGPAPGSPLTGPHSARSNNSTRLMQSALPPTNVMVPSGPMHTGSVLAVPRSPRSQPGLGPQSSSAVPSPRTSSPAQASWALPTPAAPPKPLPDAPSSPHPNVASLPSPSMTSPWQAPPSNFHGLPSEHAPGAAAGDWAGGSEYGASPDWVNTGSGGGAGGGSERRGEAWLVRRMSQAKQDQLVSNVTSWLKDALARKASGAGAAAAPPSPPLQQ
ncbi:hypothetical protein HYH03_007499 [Edaphochlamys debaryana]|uniref:Uncharacterized protein n=1 Tax=Edaphochlamys debaryana TaxID=47281 RepID=A0A835Y0L7_9CHLO|nr:hypothetical protein HYH03_007499 [Edaphochlamys debaryana]|eukprot:KAG2494447.1 hypothetical protein HYH03_007499 [Edaphochlamys debaryana]